MKHNIRHMLKNFKLMELCQECWRNLTLFEIASAVCTPLTIDASPLNMVFGHCTLILVYMDFSKRILEEILVEREGYAFNVLV